MATYISVARSLKTPPSIHRHLMQSYKSATSRVIIPHIHRVIKTTTPQTRNMAFLMPRVAFAPARCGPARHDLAPLFSLFDSTLNEVARPSRQPRRSFAPRFDVKEEKDSYYLEGELPGVDEKGISVEFTDEHTLTIRGRSERHTESGTPPTTAAVEASEKSTVQDGTATPASDDASAKSHQPTVEDEDAPANSSAAAESSSQVAPAPTQPQPANAEAPKPQYWISERSVGQFERSFTFPTRVDQDAVKASLKSGILSIVVPKAKVPESRRINIE